VGYPYEDVQNDDHTVAFEATGTAELLGGDDASDATANCCPDAAAVTSVDRLTEPETVATRLCEGFKRHDDRQRSAAIEAFAAVDSFQFRHLDAGTVRQAATAYVDALWAKDAVEDRHRRGGDAEGEIDQGALAAADWSAVESALSERAARLGIDAEYATLTTAGWRKHKTGGDYWTPHLRAQQLELRAVLRDPSYPHKPRHGTDGAGPEATRYLLGVELHDCRRWTEATDVMVPYFAAIERARSDDEPDVECGVGDDELGADR